MVEERCLRSSSIMDESLSFFFVDRSNFIPCDFIDLSMIRRNDNSLFSSIFPFSCKRVKSNSFYLDNIYVCIEKVYQCLPMFDNENNRDDLLCKRKLILIVE